MKLIKKVQFQINENTTSMQQNMINMITSTNIININFYLYLITHDKI